MADDWKDDYSHTVQQAMKQAGWAMHLFQATAAGIVQLLTDDELDELDVYISSISTTNCWWAEYEAVDQMQRAIDEERRRRWEQERQRDQGQPVILSTMET